VIRLHLAGGALAREAIEFAALVDIAKLRWRIERDYQELKQEVGLGHFEGYDATTAAEASISRIQHAVLNEKVSIDQAQRGGTNILPECIDAFSPHLLAALIILQRGKLDSLL
jgi:hypothetical protein